MSPHFIAEHSQDLGRCVLFSSIFVVPSRPEAGNLPGVVSLWLLLQVFYVTCALIDLSDFHDWPPPRGWVNITLCCWSALSVVTAGCSDKLGLNVQQWDTMTWGHQMGGRYVSIRGSAEEGVRPPSHAPFPRNEGNWRSYSSWRGCERPGKIEVMIVLWSGMKVFEDTVRSSRRETEDTRSINEVKPACFTFQRRYSVDYILMCKLRAFLNPRPCGWTSGWLCFSLWRAGLKSFNTILLMHMSAAVLSGWKKPLDWSKPGS